MSAIPQEDEVRKSAPIYRGVLAFFPWALFKVAAHSFRSDRKHNPDRPESEAPKWAREKSTDHADCILRHLAEAHTDPDYHLAAIAWRALALLQEHGEKKHGALPGPGSVFPEAAESPGKWKLVDTDPVGDYQQFEGQTFSSREFAQRVLQDEVDAYFHKDFLIQRVP